VSTQECEETGPDLPFAFAMITLDVLYYGGTDTAIAFVP